MIVKLPKVAVGSKIVEAFMRANLHRIDDNHKWMASEFVDEYQYELGAVSQKSVLNKGVTAHSFSFEKKYVFWGKKVWKKDSNLMFKLKPVVLDQEYKKVDIEIVYIYDVDQGGIEYVATNPHDSEFKKIEPQLKDMLERFIHELE